LKSRTLLFSILVDCRDDIAPDFLEVFSEESSLVDPSLFRKAIAIEGAERGDFSNVFKQLFLDKDSLRPKPTSTCCSYRARESRLL